MNEEDDVDNIFVFVLFIDRNFILPFYILFIVYRIRIISKAIVCTVASFYILCMYIEYIVEMNTTFYFCIL